MRALTLAIVIVLAAMAPTAWSTEINGNAFVSDDGTLRIQGNTIRLYGILIPATDQTCQFFIRPAPCGPRAVLALKFDIGSHFVHCKPTGEEPSGTIIAICTAGDENLSTWLLQQGWAAALPDAPYQYHVLEKIARARGIGIWGLPVVRRR
jgi:endonuclease YncB( thermonuclease family)